MEEKIINKFNTFISDLEIRLKDIGVELEGYPVDHVCYRAGSFGEYLDLFNKFRDESVLYTTKHFHERNFHLFVLKDPLKYKSISIPYLEFSEPGGSDDYATGFQHLEFYSKISIEDLIIGNELATPLLYKGKYDGEAYLKWPDKVAVKFTSVPIITKSLLEDNPTIKITGN